MPRADRGLEQTLIRFSSDEAESLSLRVRLKLIHISRSRTARDTTPDGWTRLELPRQRRRLAGLRTSRRIR
jgi:hypothetical protein